MDTAPTSTASAAPIGPLDMSLALILATVAKRDRMKRRDRMASSLIDDVLAMIERRELSPTVIRLQGCADPDARRRDAERRRLCEETRDKLQRIAPLARALSEAR